MYHEPKMCRTCLQSSRGDYKFVSLDSVDPSWESNSPNLQQQLISIVPEMKVETAGTVICTSCFIALRTAFEFKRMCEVTEKKFQNHSFKYRRPFGIGPGSAQFHVALNDNRASSKDPDPVSGSFRCKNLKFLQADTSIDITEHHLYDASKVLPKRHLNYLNNVTQKLPEIDVEVILPEQQKIDEEASAKKLNSTELRKRYNIGSEISILKNDKNQSTQALVKTSCQEIPFLNENGIDPDKLNCFIRIEVLTDDFVKSNTGGKYLCHELKDIANSYYFEELDELLNCQFCSKTFSTRFSLQLHEDEHAVDKFFNCTLCDMQFIIKNSLDHHLKDIHKIPTEENPQNNITEPLLPADKVAPLILNNSDQPPASESQEKSTVDTNIKVETKKIDQTHENNISPPKKSIQPKILQKPTIKNRLKSIKYTKCFICNKTCRTKLQMRQHLNFCHIPNITPMYWSNINARSRLNLNSITNKEVEVSKTSTPYSRVRKIDYTKLFGCTICSKRFSEEKYLTLHMYCHIPVVISRVLSNPFEADDGPAPFLCYLCDKRFPKERFLKLHNQQVHLIKTATCETCGRVFKSEFWFGRHRCVSAEAVEEEEEVVVTDQKYPCTFCDRSFNELRYMRSHRKRTHGDLMEKRNTRSNSDDSPDKKQIKLDFDDEDPMKLYEVAASSPVDDDEEDYDDDEDDDDDLFSEKGAWSDNSDTQDEDSDNLENEDNFHTIKAEKIKNENPGRNSSLINVRRRSYNRSTGPKIQCDFCGERIEEKLYDNHIFEHNKIRLQKCNRKADGDTNVSLENGFDNVLLTCNVCSKTFMRKYNLLNHMRKHEIEEHLNSEIGDDGTINEQVSKYILQEQIVQNEINQKQTIVQDNLDVYECCGRIFRFKHHFARHYKNKHCGTSGEKFEISTVRDSTGKIVHLNTSRRRRRKPAETINDVECKSDHYDDSADDMPLNKRKHIDSDSEKPKKRRASEEADEEIKFKYHCLICRRKFRQRYQLKDHANVHTGQKPYICLYCSPEHGFTQTSSLYVHYRRVHAKIVQHCEWEVYSKNGRCLSCTERFDRHSEMFWHVKEYYDEESFKCEVCKGTFNMFCHYRVHDMDPDSMGVLVNTKRKLRSKDKEDEEDEEDETKPKEHCHECDKSFNSKRKLKFHKKSLAHFQHVQLVKKLLTSKGVSAEGMRTSKELETIEEIQESVKVIMDKISTIKRAKHRCQQCGMCFIRKMMLRKHKRKMHRAKPKAVVKTVDDVKCETILDENHQLNATTSVNNYQQLPKLEIIDNFHTELKMALEQPTEPNNTEIKTPENPADQSHYNHIPKYLKIAPEFQVSSFLNAQENISGGNSTSLDAEALGEIKESVESKGLEQLEPRNERASTPKVENAENQPSMPSNLEKSEELKQMEVQDVINHDVQQQATTLNAENQLTMSSNIESLEKSDELKQMEVQEQATTLNAENQQTMSSNIESLEKSDELKQMEVKNVPDHDVQEKASKSTDEIVNQQPASSNLHALEKPNELKQLEVQNVLNHDVQEQAPISNDESTANQQPGSSYLESLEKSIELMQLEVPNVRNDDFQEQASILNVENVENQQPASNTAESLDKTDELKQLELRNDINHDFQKPNDAIAENQQPASNTVEKFDELQQFELQNDDFPEQTPTSSDENVENEQPASNNLESFDKLYAGSNLPSNAEDLMADFDLTCIESSLPSEPSFHDINFQLESLANDCEAAMTAVEAEGSSILQVPAINPLEVVDINLRIDANKDGLQENVNPLQTVNSATDVPEKSL